MIPERVVRVRMSYCRGHCKADPTDPCAACENGHWGPWTRKGCSEVQAQNEPGLGDKIARVATPIARIMGSDCIDKATGELKSDSGCGKMKTRLNAGVPLTEALKLRLKGA